MNLVTPNRRAVYLCVLTMLFLVCLRNSQAQGVSSYDRQRGQMMLDQVKGDIKGNYYDPSFHGVDPDMVFKQGAEKIKAAQSNGQIMGVIAQTVMSLDDSHTFFIPPQRPGKYGLRTGNAGHRR
jgi:hypothetical protein